MSYKKYFKLSPTTSNGALSPISGHGNASHFKAANYGSYLPEIYSGHPNRIERYTMYNAMDCDSDVNSALDTLAEFCTQVNSQNSTTFEVIYKEKPTETEIAILKKQLQSWFVLNQFDKRMFKLFRNVLKFGDQVFLRDPETFKLHWVDMNDVVKIIVNESKGKEPEQYVIKNINPNFENLTATQVTADNYFHTSAPQGGYGASAYNIPNTPVASGSRFTKSMRDTTIDAQHIAHVSLSEGMDPNWPFGQSILELVFKTYKQKELLEDAVIIYRVQRAPERRVFYIDTGNLPSHLAMQYVERIKNEMWQRRIPTQSGGTNNAQSSFMDATYSPLCLDLETLIPLSDSRVITLAQCIVEFNQNKKLVAKSVDLETKETCDGQIDWCGITRKNVDTIKLTFNNGKYLICTPDHKIPVIGRGYVEAKDLTVFDALYPYLHPVDIDKVKFESNWEWPRVFVVEIEDAGKRDVGTLSIDIQEVVHAHHNFAIGAGIFVKNSTNEDFYLPVSADGRGSKIDTLAGGSAVGEVTDLRLFTNKLFRGLRIPSSYLPTGSEDSPSVLNDGKVGTALIQEFRFNQYCKRLQNLIIQTLDTEFKLYLKWLGINISSGMFELKFTEPQNFVQYRKVEVDQLKISTFAQLEAVPYFSKRFIMERYLGLSQEELLQNQILWREENLKDYKPADMSVSLRDSGVTPGMMDSDEAGLTIPEPEAEQSDEQSEIQNQYGGTTSSPAEPVSPPTTPTSNEPSAEA